jgi:hypothetical protein
MNPSYDLPFTIYLDGGDELRDALIKVCYAAESAHYRTGNPHESTDKAVEMLQYGIKYLQSFRPAPEIAPPDDGAPADAVDTTGDLDLAEPPAENTTPPAAPEPAKEPEPEPDVPPDLPANPEYNEYTTPSGNPDPEDVASPEESVVNSPNRRTRKTDPVE